MRSPGGADRAAASRVASLATTAETAHLSKAVAGAFQVLAEVPFPLCISLMTAVPSRAAEQIPRSWRW